MGHLPAKRGGQLETSSRGEAGLLWVMLAALLPSLQPNPAHSRGAPSAFRNLPSPLLLSHASVHLSFLPPQLHLQLSDDLK